LLAEVRQHGLAALAHGNRGRPSPRRLAEAIRTKVLALARTTYAGVNDHHLTELLAEREGLHLSRPLVRLLLRKAGIGSPRTRRPPRHRRRRERMPQAGLLVQMDGSHHAWLEARGPRLVLLSAIDDATNRVLGAVFRLAEDAQGYFLLLRQMIRTYGLPVALYTDRHGIFHRDPHTPVTLDEQLRGAPELTQLGRALHELGIRWIPASSPQAKGRIERLFGTFQDRLVSELRVARAATLAEANLVLRAFLPRFNARFARPPAQPRSAFRPGPAGQALDTLCCFKYARTVANDNTVGLAHHRFQLLPGPGGRSYAKARVEIHERLDGSFAVYQHGQRLASRALTPVPSRTAPTLRARDYTRLATAPRPRNGTTHAASPPARPPATPRDDAGSAAPPTGHAKRAKPAPDHPWNWYALEAVRRKALRQAGVTFSLIR
ncbi:MAG TPA: ISNCY family transposase, partial [bacterium]|nr:ISNCY family transposase [bacterium]